MQIMKSQKGSLDTDADGQPNEFSALSANENSHTKSYLRRQRPGKKVPFLSWITVVQLVDIPSR